MFSTYLIGSLRNPGLPLVAEQLRAVGVEVFDDWYAAGPTADDEWQKYERNRGKTYAEALESYAATHTFEYDLKHLKRCKSAILVTPAGKSGHLELGVMLGWGKPGWILVQDTTRWDVMYKFASKVFTGVDELVAHVKEYAKPKLNVCTLVPCPNYGKEFVGEVCPGNESFKDTPTPRTIGVIDLTKHQERIRHQD